jgi:hypothetical protein
MSCHLSSRHFFCKNTNFRFFNTKCFLFLQQNLFCTGFLAKEISFIAVKFLVTKFEFGGSFGMSYEGLCHEIEVTPNLELFITFGMSLEGVCHDLYT